MSYRHNRGLLAALIASLTAIGLNFYTSQKQDTRTTTSDGPDLLIVDPVWSDYDTGGNRVRELAAAGLEQQPGAAQAVLTEPRLTLLDPHLQTWQASARSGQLDEDSGTLVLERQVQLRREPPSRRLVLETERLLLTAGGNRLETDQAVVLKSGNWQVSGKGLEADLDKQKLDISGGVRGVHDQDDSD